MSILDTLPSADVATGAVGSHPHYHSDQQANTSLALSFPSNTQAHSSDRRASAIEDRARAMLRSSCQWPVRHVACEVSQRVLILRGRVPSFYMKQVAQTCVRDLQSDGVIIKNQVEVDWT